MSTFTFLHGLPTYDWQELLATTLGAGTRTGASDASFTLVVGSDPEVKLVFTGLGFTYGANGLLTGGSFTGGSLIVDGETVVTLDGYGSGNEPGWQNYNNSVDVIRGGGSAEDIDLATAQWLQTEAATVIGSDDAEVLRSSRFNDTLDGNGGNDTIYGGSGNDSLDGGAGDDDLLGGNGNDTLSGGDGEDRLRGGVGNDSMVGGGASDQTADFFAGGRGDDTMVGGVNENEHNRVQYDIETDYGDDDSGTYGVIVNLSGQAGDAEAYEEIASISIGGHTLSQLGAGEAFDSYGDRDTLVNIQNASGTKYGDILIGGPDDSDFDGRGGNDLLIGGSGNNQYRGGDGDDTIIGGDGDDFAEGGRGTNYMDGGESDREYDNVQYLEASSGIIVNKTSSESGTVFKTEDGETDTFVNFEIVVGSNHADTFNGSDENDDFTGNAGNDTFNGGDGSDLIQYEKEQYAPGGQNTHGVIVNMANHALEGVYLEPGDDVVTVEASSAIDGFGDIDQLNSIERIRGTNFRDIIIGSDTGRSEINGEGGNDFLQLTGEWDPGQDNSSGYLDGGAGDDFLVGDNYNNDLNGGTGDDFIDARGGQFDYISGSSGQDTIDGGDGYDMIGFKGDNSADSIHVVLNTGGLDEFGAPLNEMGSGTITGVFHDGWDNETNQPVGLSVNATFVNLERVVGTAGNDIFENNGFNPTGNAEWVFGDRAENPFTAFSFVGGAGADTFIDTTGTSTATVIDYDEEKWSHPNYDGEHLWGSGEGERGVAVNFSGADIVADGDTIATGTARDTFGDTDTINGVKAFRLTDANDTFYAGNGGDFEADGRQGDDLLVGADGNDFLIGDQGNDTLSGGAGNDTLRLGEGNDSATGGSGSDTFELSTGADTITDFSVADGDYLSLSRFEEIQSLQDLLDHLVDPDNHGDMILYLGDGNITTLSGVDYDTLTEDNLIFFDAQVIDGTEDGDDPLEGTDASEVINGLGGNDRINGYGGNDTLNGGAGDDTLRGGQGNDVLDGGGDRDRADYDQIDDPEGQRGVIVNLSDDTVFGARAEGQGTRDVSGRTAIDSFGDTDTLIDIEGVRGTSYADLLIGNDDRNSLEGKAGDDTLIGAGGDDFLRGDAGRDEIHGGSGFDMLSNETLNSADTVTVTFSTTEAGAGTMTGMRGVDVIDTQFDGIEAVRSWSGNDTFIAAAGVEGTEDSDRFYINDGIDETYDEFNSIRVSGGQGDDTFTDETENGVLFVDYREDRQADGGAPYGVWVNVSDNELSGVAAHTALDAFGDTDTLNGVRAFQLTDRDDVFQALDSDTSFHVRAGGGDDFLQGGNGNDTLNGDDGNDTIYGGAGMDDIQGGDGDDEIWSGEGDHGENENRGGSIHGGRGNDTIYGGDGSEFITISWGDDVIDGDGGNDMLAIRRADNNDDNEPDHSGDFIDVYFSGGPGGGAMSGSYGGENMSVLFDNVERVRGTTGDDSFTAFGDAAATEDGPDFYLSDQNPLTDDRHFGIGVTGGDGADTFTDTTGVQGGVLIVDYQEEKWTHDDYDGGAFGNGTTQFGVIVNMSDTTKDGVASGTARDTFGKTDTIEGVHAFRLSDAADKFYAGNDGYAVQAGDGNDTLIGGTGDDNLSGDAGNDSVVGGDGDDWVGGWRGNDTLDGGDGDDSLEGEGGDDSMTGGAGNDWFRGGAGADFMDGGAEDDKVQYREERDDNGNFGTQGVVVNLTDDAVTIDLGDRDVTVQGHSAKDSFGSIDTIISISNVEGTDQADYIKGDDGFNELVGNGGNDTLLGGEGEGQFDGGDGDDLMTGGSSDDFFRAGQGNDTVDGGGNGEGEYDNLEYFEAENGIVVTKNSRGGGTVDGAWAGHDTFENIEIVVGTAFADVFNGSNEDDDFTGYKGADTFNGGDGFDRVVYEKDTNGPDRDNAHGVIVNLSDSQIDDVAAEGIASTSVAAHRAIDAYGYIDTLNGIESVEGTDFGDYLKASDTDYSNLQGRDGDDTIVAGAFDGEGNNANQLEGGRGDDSIIGGDFNDQISAGNGDDTVLAGAGHDYIRGSAGGDDRVDGGDGYDMIGFGGTAGDADGKGITVTFDLTGVAGGGVITGEIYDYDQNQGSVNTTFEDIERIEGTDADDVFQVLGNGFVNGSNSSAVFVNYMIDGMGSQGVFDLSGGAGDDTFIDLSTTAGGVLLVSYEGERWSHPDYDGHLWGSEAGEHGVIVNFSNAEKTAIAFDFNDGTDPSNVVVAANSGIDTYGNTDSYDGIRMTWLTAADDWLWASDAGVFAYGERGNDRLFGGNGADMLVGGEGNDTLIGGGGQDTLTYALDSGTTDKGVIVNLSATGQTIGGQFVEGFTALDNWGATDTLAGFEIVVGTAHNDVILGGDGGMILIGGSGDDQLVGGAGSDALRGGQGDDMLQGGGGDDWVDYRREGLLDHTAEWPFPGDDAPVQGVIVNLSDDDIVVGGETVAANHALDTFGTTDALDSIENVDGSEAGDFVLGSSGNNQIRGFGGDDTLNGGGGTDAIYGGEGNDTIVFEGGNVTVGDFVAGGADDRVDLSAFENITSLSQLLSHLSDANNHSNAVFVIDGQTLTLSGVDYADLTSEDFLFGDNVAPEITSGGGGATANVNVVEGTTAVTTVVASDANPDDDLVYSIAGGADGIKFVIDSGTGELSFVTPPDREGPTDTGSNNVYEVIVKVSDGHGGTDTQTISVTVTDTNDTAPTITSNGGGATASVSVAENAGLAVTTVTASDPDTTGTLSYSISGGADGALFSINPTTGQLGFNAIPNFEAAADVDHNNVYQVEVAVSDGVTTDKQMISVTVTDVNEAPSFTSGFTRSVQENNTAVMTVTGSDPDTGQTLTYSIIAGGADNGKFQIDAATGVLSFASAPNFEAPGDADGNNVYEVAVQISDGHGGNTTSGILVTVTNQNEAPAITSNGGGATAAVSIDEGSTAVTTVTASDPDAGASLTYAISGGADQALFTINTVTGDLSFITPPNYGVPTDAGGNNVYDVQVTASDGSLTDVQSIAVTVNATNVAPVITSNGGGATASVSMAENLTAVTTVHATDADGDTLTYRLAGGADAARFSINATTGQLSFIAPPDFETPIDAGADNVYNVVVEAWDGKAATSQAIAITISDGNGVTIIGTNGADVVNASQTVPGQPLPTNDDDNIGGMGGNDSLSGLAGNDTLDGGLGVDTMSGGLGDDTFWVDDSADVVTESASQGTDTVHSTAASYTLGSNVENLVLEAGAVSGTGNSLGNVITGNDDNNTINGGGGADTLNGGDGNDTIDGGTGNDSMTGGAGDDTYYVDSGTDVIVEGTDEGTDKVYSTAAIYTLGLNVEDIELQGTGNIQGIGNDLDNHLTGNSGKNYLGGGAGDDTLDGGLGVDTMSGGLGDDTYWVDNGSDVVTESASQGNDTVNTSVSYTLSSNVENLALLSGAAAGTGNSLGNIITGNDGNNTINGGGGADTLIGGDGNDEYYVDNAGDVIVEAAGKGTDTVYSSAAIYTLGTDVAVEYLVLTGTSNLQGIGNNLDNIITGNSGKNYLGGGAGNDTLDGGLGVDTMSGGLGDDTFWVDDSADVVTESASQGTDTVHSTAASYTLGSNVENLVLEAGAVSGTGNSLGNVITGNDDNNTINGGGGADTLNGGDGNDTIDGGTGNDSMTGGAGDDTYYVDSGTDVIVEGTDEGTDKVYSTAAIYTLGLNVEDIELQGTGNIQGIGNDLDNHLTGNSGKNYLGGGAGDDTLDGGLGVDTMSGGLGDDTYWVDNGSDVVTESASQGNDTVNTSVSYTLSSNVENLALLSGAAAGTGNSLGNIITGNDGNNTINGGGGADTLIGGDGNDEYYVDNAGDVIVEAAGKGTDTVYSSAAIYTLGTDVAVEYLVLTGTSNLQGIGNNLDNIITGNSGKNYLGGGAGNDTLDGGLGVDTMSGGLGDDTFWVDDSADVVTESASQGTDTVHSTAASYTLGSNVENLVLEAGAVSGTGNSLGNVITGNDDNNTINGGGGADTLNGGDGNDTIDGGTGNDSMTGGAGDDTYYVDSGTDVIVEGTDEGTDKVYSTAAIYTLGLNVEDIELQGTGNIQGIGNDLDNHLTGNSGKNYLGGGAGDDTLDGGLGVDTMSGGLGDDTYWVDNGSDVVTESASQGNDTVNTSVSYTLSSNVENLALLSGAAAGTGNSLGNIITGNDGNNTINGGGGADTLIGGDGNDEYYVDNAGDVIVEAAGKGTDTVYSSAAIYTLGTDVAVEYLVLTGTSNLQGIGNNLDNIITGNSGKNYLGGGAGNDTLDGGLGVDTMSGGLGDDTFWVDDSADVVTESASQGTDTVHSTAASYTLGSNVENLVLEAGAVSGTGNSLGNVITGNDDNNTINGGGGADTLNGGDGNDIYYVDNTNDVVVEASGKGTDTVYSTATIFTIGTGMEIEQVFLTGTGNIQGIGNELDNHFVGNSGKNWLGGGAGNDTLDGGLGNDTMKGGDGNDTFVFNTALSATNVDTITDFTTGDKISLATSVFGSLTQDNFVFGTAAGDADDRLIYNSSTGVLMFDADGNGSGAAVDVAKLSNLYSLSFSDFEFV